MIKMCCVCHRIERQGEWHRGRLLAEHEQVTHGYCPDCFVGVMAEISTYIGEREIGDVRSSLWSPPVWVCDSCA